MERFSPGRRGAAGIARPDAEFWQLRAFCPDGRVGVGWFDSRRPEQTERDSLIGVFAPVLFGVVVPILLERGRDVVTGSSVLLRWLPANWRQPCPHLLLAGTPHWASLLMEARICRDSP